MNADRRLILAIDTSSAQGSLALYDGRRLSLRSWPADRSHTTTVITEVHHLLDQEAVAVRDLAAIAIAKGPGAFTGLRVGFGVAKGFHLATGVPLIGVPTLEATAFPFAMCGALIVPVIPAGRGRLVWAQYLAVTEGVVEARPARNGTVSELIADLPDGEAIVVAGELDDDQAENIRGATHAMIPPPALRGRQPAALAEIGWRRWIAGQTDDATRLEPVYVSR